MQTYFGLIVLIFLALPSSAQLNKANRMFANEAYSQAARLYEKVLEKDSTRRVAINNIAHCYRHEKRYKEARRYFQKSLRFSSGESNNYFYFAKMEYLLRNYEKAEEVLERYLSAVPEDEKAAQLLEWTKEVKNYSDRTDYEVVTLHGINSPYADFAPVVYNAGLVFTTERKSNPGEEEFAIEVRPFTNIYYAPFSNKQQTSFWNPDIFAPKLTTRFHDGPACFNRKGNTIYYTHVERQLTGPARINKMKIFVSHRVGDEWSDPEPFEYNSTAYSVAHPALSDDDSLLLFTSDMPGGYGGMDLYMSRYENDRWNSPVNLGPTVNSTGDEVFPHMVGNTIYFSSNGWPSYGGLDLFSVHLDSLEQQPRNLRYPINSGWDDLSLSFLNEHKAYFSSDRPGGSGRDDIYGLERVAPSETHRELSGILEYNEQPAPHASLSLKDPTGNVVQKTVTDDAGYFSWDFVKSNVPYTISLDVDEKERLKQFAIFLLNDRKEKVKKISAGESGDFKFELLPPDDFDNLELLEVEDASLLSIDIHGQVSEEVAGDVTDRIEIVVLNADGEVIGRTFTRNDGTFLFRQLFPDDQYIFRLLADNPGLKITILDDQGNVLQALTRTGKEFIYNRIGEGDPILSLLNERNVTIKISPDDRFAIPNIYYDLDAYQLNDHARKQLERLVVILDKNPEIGVNVMSHTDSRASDQYNLKLSEKRAAEVIRHLETRGISANRMSAKGFGEKNLVNHCKNDVACPEDEHAKNRRTEFSLHSRLEE